MEQRSHDALMLQAYMNEAPDELGQPPVDSLDPEPPPDPRPGPSLPSTTHTVTSGSKVSMLTGSSRGFEIQQQQVDDELRLATGMFLQRLLQQR